MNGVLIIDKPSGLTSHDVVNRVRRILQERSVGHLGTLDPMATGVLPLVTGNFTRLAQFYTASEKTYEGTVRFGFSTDTYDAEGEATSPPQNVTLSREEVELLAAKFRGVIEQMPPPFSAKKIQGVPAYKLARKNKEVVLKAVPVEIKEFEILSVETDRATFRARVASGTYMRSVAHEMGQHVGCGAHLESLRRTTAAEFTLEDAYTLDQLADIARQNVTQAKVAQANVARALTPAYAETVRNAVGDFSESGTSAHHVAAPAVPPSLEDCFVHPRKLLPLLPSVTADEPTVARIRAGRPVNLPELSRARLVKVFSGQRELIAIATRVAGTLFHAKIVLCNS